MNLEVTVFNARDLSTFSSNRNQDTYATVSYGKLSFKTNVHIKGNDQGGKVSFYFNFRME